MMNHEKWWKLSFYSFIFLALLLMFWLYDTCLKRGLTSSCPMFQTRVGSPKQWRFPSPSPWEQPWWAEEVCSAYSSSNEKTPAMKEGPRWQQRVFRAVKSFFSHRLNPVQWQLDTYRADKSLQEVFAEQSQGHGPREELHIRRSLHKRESRECWAEQELLLGHSHTHVGHT